jgi:hypothetical protein
MGIMTKIKVSIGSMGGITWYILDLFETMQDWP